MCGVIGLVTGKPRADLGRVASGLLRALEYRGYDSTGAAIQGEGTDVRLAKGVGPPSRMVRELGIDQLAGQLLCGQVRWATFGAVTEENCQPHLVRCRTFIYGAHNGNVTNCDALKTWLLSRGHQVLGDNDGEMVVHLVEHLFAEALAQEPEPRRAEPEVRRRLMRAAIGRAAARIEGSLSAVVVDPVSRTAWAAKLGSSLYFGVGSDERGGSFCLASSDLSSVLTLTRMLVPMSEGEVVEFDALGWSLWGLDRRPGAPLEPRRLAREPSRSRLRAEEIALRPPFETFMEQEIAAQEATVRQVVELFEGGSGDARALGASLDSSPETLRELGRQQEARREPRDRLEALAGSPEIARLSALLTPEDRGRLLEAPAGRMAERLASSEAFALAELLAVARGPEELLAVRLLDLALEREEVSEFGRAVESFCAACLETLASGGRIFAVSCGSSFHAVKAAALFFNQVARVELVPVLPGEFRGQHARSLRDGDLFIAVSQSGETKDLIDVANDVIASGRRVRRVAVVNNVNSTLAQEKSELVIPLRCGPEIAVPATKSFTNQVAIFYGLALELAARRLADPALGEAEREEMRTELADRRSRLSGLPALLRAAAEATAADVEAVARLLHLAPSMHILATRISAVAKEGALKVREVLLNHTEGFEGSEFKHGPNTILGFNTVFGPAQVDALLGRLGEALDRLVVASAGRGVAPEAMGRLVRAAAGSVLSAQPRLLLDAGERELLVGAFDRGELAGALGADYPLIFVTGPEDRDVALTVSQINTHKIRGAWTVVVAEESAALRGAARKAPANSPGYRWAYLCLPATGDTLMTVFTATVVLQRLALRMSLMKASYLDGLGIRNHGVHPDVPKNVSKSITVD